MALPVQQQAKFWGLAIAVFMGILWFLGDVILPFVLGGAIAYCLDPIADKLEKWGASRVLATVIITVSAIVIFVLAMLLIVPTLVSQASDLIAVAPKLFQDLQSFLTDRFPSLVDAGSPMRQQLQAIGEAIQSRGGELLNSVLSSAMGVINVVVLIVLVPVVTFYLLLDWDRMVAKIDDLLPRDHVHTVRKLAKEMDKTLASFIRGMGTVCLALGTYYAVALMAVGLQFGLVVGFIAGLITFIPYVGALVGGMLAIGLALFQFWGDWTSLGMVAGIFIVGQIIEGNILTPKLVGDSVGLHPVWLIFSLSVFGTLFGFVGMLVAVPVAAMFGVLARFAINEYKGGLLYNGYSGLAQDSPEDDETTGNG
ncbi:AI-2E family transporter [Parasulfitobacter algicola]|uniref:AI-2E family transporter n=1 Tax=Parasulfitobacter algicola TaxID=2614809 RepID=A0ABX2IZC7_9RHOB|nr:AI-2E family transporter [Sulfitobacter algicola]NSX56740.1 AI-2E family transporter [Sulfitobacter algicola]